MHLEAEQEQTTGDVTLQHCSTVALLQCFSRTRLASTRRRNESLRATVGRTGHSCRTHGRSRRHICHREGRPRGRIRLVIVANDFSPIALVLRA